MSENIYDILDWSYKNHDKLKSPTWDMSHNYHIKDMLNTIKQIHDGTFDEDLANLSKRVTNIEGISRHIKCIDFWSADEAKSKIQSMSTLNHPYLKRSGKNSQEKNKENIKENAKVPSFFRKQSNLKSQNICKNKVDTSKITYLQHTPSTKTSIIPLYTDCRLPINILPLKKTNCIYNISENLHTLKKKKRLNQISNINSNKCHKIFSTKAIKDKHSRLKMEKGSDCNNENIITHKSTLIPKKCRQYNDSGPQKVSNGKDKIIVKYSSEYNSTSSEDNITVASQADCFIRKLTSNELLNSEISSEINKNTIPTRCSQSCQTLPFDAMVNILKPQDNVDMKKILTLYNISIDPEFMEEELERFSLRLYERIKYYIEEEQLSFNIDNFLQKICSDKDQQVRQIPTVKEELINLEEDSINSIPNEIFNDTPGSSSDIINTIVNSFKNTSFHKIVMKELLIDRQDNDNLINYEISGKKEHENQTIFDDNISQRTKSEIPSTTDSSKSRKYLTEENVESEQLNKTLLSYTVSEGQSSVKYTDDFVPWSSSSLQNREFNTNNEDIFSLVKSASYTNGALMQSQCDHFQNTVRDMSSKSENLIVDTSGPINSLNSKIIHDTNDKEIGDTFEISQDVLAEDSSLSIQLEKNNVSDGEFHNLSYTLPQKEKKIRFQDPNNLSEVDSSAVIFSELSIVANDFESFESGKIQIEPCYSDADVTISSGEILRINPPSQLFKNQEMFQLYKENEILRQRLAFIKRTS